MKKFFPFLIGLFFIIGICVYMLQFTLYMEANTCIESGGAWSNELNECLENKENTTNN